ncbi:VOC family protein [Methylocucumis oryzae]|uniref:Lactoylglutathione lyase n=1 Tax=Methylocucumis oryzae TaxID=1632867 RepID=A0A0F3IGD1_9GAMM|nr:VOC family protein [Methylocucumis oryzae]KJV05811.1 lactoylglutathione lyase [Methylocucumis oryzae]
MHNPVGWFEIYVQDLDRAKQFYETVFQAELERIDNMGLTLWKFPQSMQDYGSSGALIKMEGFASGGNSTLVYFSCADCSVEAARAPDAGGKIIKEKFAIGPYGFIAIVEDTEGNMIGLHSRE